MKDRSNRIVGTSVSALIVVGLGSLISYAGVSTCTVECYVPILAYIGAVVAITGVLIGIVSLSMAVWNAIGRRDTATGMLLILCMALSIGAIVYVDGTTYYSIVLSFTRIGLQPNSVVTLFFLLGSATPLGWDIPLYAAPAVFALLYSRPRAPRVSRIGLGMVSAAVVIIALVAAPPWVTLNQPSLSVHPLDALTSCVQGQYPPITVTNAGRGTLRWTASTAVTGIAIHPASGSLGPGATQTATLSGEYLPSDPANPDYHVTITFASNAGSQVAIYRCEIASSLYGTITTRLGGISADCRHGTYPPFKIFNDSSSDVFWYGRITVPFGSNTVPGISISPPDGLLHAGQSQTIAISGTTTVQAFVVTFNSGENPVMVACT